MIRILKALPSSPKVYVMVPPPLWEPYPYNMQSDVINTIYPVLIRVIGTWQDVEVIDNWTPLSYVDNSLDGCHPNDAGHKIIAANVAGAIKQSKLQSGQEFLQ